MNETGRPRENTMRKQAPQIELPKKSRSWVNESHRDPHAKMFLDKTQSVISDLDAGDGIHTEYTEAGMVVFDQGTAVLPDDSRANEMVAELKSRKGNHRDRYAFTPHREGHKRSGLHPMRIMSIAMPWHKDDEYD